MQVINDTQTAKDRRVSLAVCLTVWNRPDLFSASLASLLERLGGIDAEIWIIDNGSDKPTKLAIANAESAQHRIFKVILPINMGIPHAVNVFFRMAEQACSFADYAPADYVMIADPDCYFTRPVLDMIEILKSHRNAAIIGGHDSIEHDSQASYVAVTSSGQYTVKEKTIERGCCLVMKREFLAECVPIPHQTEAGVDWHLCKEHPNSAAARGLKVLAVDNVVHLGLYDSTWHTIGAPAGLKQVYEVNATLRKLGLMFPDRERRMEDYCRASGIVFPPQRVFEVVLTERGHHTFAVPASISFVRLVSEPHVLGGDTRKLGAAISGISINDHAIPLSDRSLIAGFHDDEGTHRWTDGTALVPIPLRENPSVLEVSIVAVAAEQARGTRS